MLQENVMLWNGELILQIIQLILKSEGRKTRSNLFFKIYTDDWKINSEVHGDRDTSHNAGAFV